MRFQRTAVPMGWMQTLAVAGCVVLGTAMPNPVSGHDAGSSLRGIQKGAYFSDAVSLAIESLATSEIAKLVASDASEKDLFGSSVAIDGDTVVIGTIWDSDSASVHAGSAYIFMRDQGGTDAWGQVAKLTASDAAGWDYFGWSVAISGDTVVVGARYNSLSGLNESGAAYIFTRNQGGADAWGQVAKLTASDAASYDDFGYSVAISGDTVVVGAVRDDHPGMYNAGSAYVFMRDQGGADAWGEMLKITASDAEPGDEFGTSVAIHGDTVVVGALLDDHPGMLEAGSAYIFMRNQGGANTWGQVAKITASDGEAGDEFGVSVAVDVDTAVVGVAGYAGERAYVFERDSGGTDAWGQVAKLTASDASSNDDFGFSVAVNQDIVVVGAKFGGPSGTANAGSAYIFMRNEGGANAWGEAAKLTASDGADEDRFGISVAVDGEIAVIGANGDDYSDMTSAGSVYIFGLTHSSIPIFTDGFESSDTTEWSGSSP